MENNFRFSSTQPVMQSRFMDSTIKVAIHTPETPNTLFTTLDVSVSRLARLMQPNPDLLGARQTQRTATLVFKDELSARIALSR